MRIRRIFAAAGVAAVAAVFAGLFAISSGSAENENVYVGVDAQVDEAANTATNLGNIENCLSVEVGDTFVVDIYVENVTGLIGYDLWLTFDGTKLEAGSGTFMFLPSGDAIVESDGSYFFGGRVFGPGADGSGVLARVSLTAQAPGLVPLVVANPWPRDPELNPGATIGIEGVFDAKIAIGQECPSDTPTPSPTNSQTPRPSPTETPFVPPTDPPTPTPPPPTPTPDTTLGPTHSPTPIRTPSPTPGPPTPTPFGTAAPTATPVPTPFVGPTAGNADCDGDTDLDDVLAIVRGDEGGCGSGDADCDGDVDVHDALRVLLFLAGVDQELPGACA